MMRPVFPIRVHSLRLFSLNQRFEPDFYHMPEPMIDESFRNREMHIISEYRRHMDVRFRFINGIQNMSNRNIYKLKYHCSNVGFVG